MKTIQLRDAKATLSALVEAAERGETTTITRHGKPVAILAPMKAASDRAAKDQPSFAEMLMSIPEEIPFERDRTPAGRVKF